MIKHFLSFSIGVFSLWSFPRARNVLLNFNNITAEAYRFVIPILSGCQTAQPISIFL